MSVKREAKWQDIATALHQEITTGKFSPGDRLPTEMTLAKNFGVNRHTVRHAIGKLIDKGLLKSEQGRGTFVQHHVFDYLTNKSPSRFTEKVTRQGCFSERRILEVGNVKAGETIALSLKLHHDAPVVHLRTLSEIDDRPMSLSSTYFSQERFPEIATLAREISSTTKLFQRCGIIDYFRQTTCVMTRLPSVREAQCLEIPANRPVLVTEALDVDTFGQPIGCGITIWAGDRIQLIFEL